MAHNPQTEIYSILNFFVLFNLVLLCGSQVNIIGIPQTERPFDLTIRDGSGKEIDTRRAYGPLTDGNTLLLYCETKNPAISHLAWSRDGIEFFGSVSRFSDGLLQNELKLTLSPADRYAEYKCRGLNLRFDPVVEKTVHLDIAGEHTQGQLSASIIPVNGTFRANEIVTLRCIVQGARGPAIITWWKGERLLNETSISSATPDAWRNFDVQKPNLWNQGVLLRRSAFFDSWDNRVRTAIGITTRNGITNTESSLTFKVTVNDNGLAIFCRAISALSQMNDNITAEASVRLDISFVPVTHIGKNDTIFSKENGPINIPCSLKSNPPADRVRWYRNDKLIYEDRIKLSPLVNDTVNTANGVPQSGADVQTNALRILQVSRNDIGLYGCEAHNIIGWGNRSNTVDVKVQYRPGPARTAKQQASTEIHAAEGEKLTLTCTVADPGNPPSFTFVWRKDGTFLTRGPTHTINSVMDKHYGAYTCAPYNGAGEGDAASIMLTKKEEAVIQTSETTVLLVASIFGVIGGTILLAIVIWCLCLNKSCKNKNKNNHLTSKFITSAYPPHTLPRPHLITNTQHSSTLSRENPPPRPTVSNQKQVSPTSATFMFGNTYGLNSSRPNYYPSWYSHQTERSNSYVGRYKY